MQHVRDSLFGAEAGTRRGVPKVIVVITDGRSQDEVSRICREMQADGKGCGAVGGPSPRGPLNKL